MKTNVKIKITPKECICKIFRNHEYFRVKLDKDKFPYIIIDNDKYLITSITFPKFITYCYDETDLKLDLIEGLDELETLVNHPDVMNYRLKLNQN